MVLKLDVEWSKAVAWKVVMELYGMVGLGFMEWTWRVAFWLRRFGMDFSA